MKESDIQQTIISYLSTIADRDQLVFFAPINETASLIFNIFKIPKKTAMRITIYLSKMGLIKGIPDIVICKKNGNVFFLELKSKNGIISKDQKNVHKALKNIDHNVYTAYSFEEAKNIIDGEIK